MSAPFKLYRLQQIDSQLDRVRARLEEVDTALNSNAAVELAEHNYNEAGASLEAERKVLRRTEEDVRTQRLKIEQNESTLYGGKIRNPKELQDLQNDVAALKRYLNVLEDRQLDAMLAFETAEEIAESASLQLDQERAHDLEQKNELRVERSKLSSDLERLEDERQAAASTIDDSELTLYEGLRRSRNGVAVVHVTNIYCPACGTVINAALLNTARQATQIIRCDLCGRILYGG